MRTGIVARHSPILIVPNIQQFFHEKSIKIFEKSIKSTEQTGNFLMDLLN